MRRTPLSRAARARMVARGQRRHPGAGPRAGPGPARLQAPPGAAQERRGRGQKFRRRPPHLRRRRRLPAPPGLHQRHPPPRPARPAVVRRAPAAGAPTRPASRSGEIMPEDEFLGLLAAVDDFDLLTLCPEVGREGGRRPRRPPPGQAPRPRPPRQGRGRRRGGGRRGRDHFRPLDADTVAGAMRCRPGRRRVAGRPRPARQPGGQGHRHPGPAPPAREVPTSTPRRSTTSSAAARRPSATATSGAAATWPRRWPRSAACAEASGADVKNFCAAPVPALVVASALVSAGVFERVAVVAGGSLAKLGMKFQGHLKNDLPVLEDVLGGAAALVERRRRQRPPQVRLDGVGRHPVAAGGSQPPDHGALALEPLPAMELPRPTSTTSPPSCTTPRSPSPRAPATSPSATTAPSPPSPPSRATSSATTSPSSWPSGACPGTPRPRATWPRPSATCPTPSSD